MLLQDCIRERRACIHFSIDDAIIGLQELFECRPQNIWDTDYFGFLRELHDHIGIAVTLYLFFSNETMERIQSSFDLSQITEQYVKEFESASDWLKFGFHAYNRQTLLISQTNEEVQKTIDRLASSITCFAGENSLATTCRPHYYSAHKDACEILKQHGVRVLFTPDDHGYTCACLPPALVKRMKQGGFYEDPESGFLLIHTSFRTENPDLNIEAMEEIMDKEIELFGTTAPFTHEYEIVGSGKECHTVREKTRQVLLHAKRRGWQFTV